MIRYREVLGKKLRLLREIYSETHGINFTQEMLADVLNYKSNGGISLVESGKRGMSQDRIMKAADFFDIEHAALFSARDMSKAELKSRINLTVAYRNKSNLLPAIEELLEKAAQQAQKPTIVE